jgi:hypothetical protein
MNPIPVVVLSEGHEFSLKVLTIPKEDVVKVELSRSVVQ